VEETPLSEAQLSKMGKQMMEAIIPRGHRERLPPLKCVDKKKLTDLIDAANAEIQKMKQEAQANAENDKREKEKVERFSLREVSGRA
jgi:hypothetical protein